MNFLGSSGLGLHNVTAVFSHAADFVVEEFKAHPYHVVIEVFFCLFLLYVLVIQATRRPTKYSKPDELSKEEIEQLCNEWQPEPLFPQNASADDEVDGVNMVLSSAATPRCVINNREVLNFATYNFLGFCGDNDILDECEGTIRKYGVGSCGPRGFYGTIDVHLELEQRIARFMGSNQSIMYSYGFSTVSSAIPAFAKRGDVIVCDQGVNFAIQTGVNLSRSEVFYFKHNDMADLERILKSITDKDKKNPKKQLNRRFIVIEGLYQNFGDIAPLQKIIELKEKYCFRIAMDDSFGIGVLGKTGRGTCEHFGIPIEQITILTANLENAFASIGGFCVGSDQVVDHQRLQGAGYCFSASLPPFLATAATEALKKLEANSGNLLGKLSDNTELMGKELQTHLHPSVRVESAPFSPIFHIRLNQTSQQQDSTNGGISRLEKEKLLQKIVDKAFEQGVALTRSKYDAKHEQYLPEPSIRVVVTAAHTVQEIKQAANVIKSCIKMVLE